MKVRDAEIRGTGRSAATSIPESQRPSGHARSVEMQTSAIDVAPRAISAKEFLLFQALIYRESGIWLSDVKIGLLTARLSKRLRMLQLKRFSEYYERVTLDLEERLTMLDVITTNETHFFREPIHFQFLEERVFTAWQAAVNARQRDRVLRVWSAGCSTGQEAYSLAMILLDHFPHHNKWSIEILATDLSRRALATAEQGVWSADKAREIPRHYLRKYTLKGVGEFQGQVKAAPSIRIVRFARLNLNDENYPAWLGKFDLIFCRNVLIYFDIESRNRVLGRLVKHLAPDGFLFVGHAETLTSACPSLRCVIPTVYVYNRTGSSERHAIGT